MRKKKLKSLAEHNAERHAQHSFAMAARPNGIACPECGNEMVDTSPNTTLTSFPPQKNVRCPSCSYSGYRIA